MSRAIPLLTLWAFVACSRVTFTFTFTLRRPHIGKSFEELQRFFPALPTKFPAEPSN
jgi:hypothetical protein